MPRLRLPAAPTSRNRGFALIAFVLLLVLVSAYLVAAAFSSTSSELANLREDRTMKALRQAKAALVAYAASEAYKAATDQPGALLCPDIFHDGTESEEGDSDCIAAGFSNSTNLIGRLPWKTLGIDDLRDASGERLWYALSHNFRKLSGITVINSDTQPCDTPACAPPRQNQLYVSGIAPANNVVAIVFAPGVPLDLRQFGGPLQNRPADHTNPAYNNPVNYLEDFSLVGDGTQFDGAHYTFTTTALASDRYNDRLLVITQAELMAAVEPVVAARIERDIKPYIQSQLFTGWSGAYPFAAPFVAGGAGPGRSQSEFKGALAQTEGLLPITTEANWVAWTSASVTQIAGGTGFSTVTPTTCSISAYQIDCSVPYTGGIGDEPNIQLQATLVNAARSFVKPPDVAADVSITGGWSGTVTPTASGVLQADGNATVTYVGRLRGGASPATIHVNAPVYHPITSSADAVSGWFNANEWYRQTYYAVSRGYRPQGGGACPSGPDPCLTVKNLPLPNNDKRAILVLTGRALNGSARPSTNPKDYLEGENCNLTAGKDLDVPSTPSTCNLTTNDYLYEHRAGVPTSINDRVVVLAP